MIEIIISILIMLGGGQEASTQRNAIGAENGMIIYNTTTGKVQARAAGAWVDLH